MLEKKVPPLTFFYLIREMKRDRRQTNGKTQLNLSKEKCGYGIKIIFLRIPLVVFTSIILGLVVRNSIFNENEPKLRLSRLLWWFWSTYH